MARPSSSPTVDTGHTFDAYLTHAWTFHATGNTGGADADDLEGSNDATLENSAALSDTVGLDCPAETDYASITQLSLDPTSSPISLLFRAKQDADNSECVVAGDNDSGDHFIAINFSGNVQVRVGGIDMSWSGVSGDTTLTDYCLVSDGGSPSCTWSLYSKAATDSTWTSHGTGGSSSSSAWLIDSLGAGFNSSSIFLQGELELFLIYEGVELDGTDLDTDFADPYDIFSAGGGSSVSPVWHRKDTRQDPKKIEPVFEYQW